jgi:hypothetical protein
VKIPANAVIADLTSILAVARDAFIALHASELLIRYGDPVLGELDIADPLRILKIQIYGGPGSSTPIPPGEGRAQPKAV